MTGRYYIRPHFTVCNVNYEEPTLGFAMTPSIKFHEFTKPFLPTANTCINVLTLPYGSITIPLPCDEKLFEMFDEAFLNAYFGNP